MELREFIMDTFSANYIDFDDKKVDQMEEDITEYARKKASKSHSIAVSDDEIRQFILDRRELMEKAKAREKEMKAREKEEKERKRKEEAENENKPYQLELF